MFGIERSVSWVAIKRLPMIIEVFLDLFFQKNNSAFGGYFKLEAKSENVDSTQ